MFYISAGKARKGADGLPPKTPAFPAGRENIMTYDEFMALDTEEEKRAIFQGLDDSKVLFDDMEAERDSFKSENEKLTAENAELKTEMKKTKELNFTLARTVGRDKPQTQSAEDILHEMFSKTGGKSK